VVLSAPIRLQEFQNLDSHADSESVRALKVDWMILMFLWWRRDQRL
jgi:hypothetical protein